MRQLGIVYMKELREMWHNRKLLWVPIVFVLLGVMEPVTTHFMPQILKMSSSLPKGTVIQIPTPSAPAVVAKAQSQFGSLGLLVLVLAFMGITSAERQRGVLELVLVKPVAFWQYITAKWCAVVSVVIVSLALGYLGAWYYTGQFIGWAPIRNTAAGASVYVLWVVLVLTLTLLFSTLFVSQIATAFLSLLIAIAVSSVSGLLGWAWSPGSLPNQAVDLITTGTALHLFACCVITLVIIACALIYGAFAIRSRVVSTKEV